MKSVLTILSVLIATTFLVTANKFLPAIRLVLHANDFINNLLKYQVFALCIAAILWVFTYQISPNSRQLLTFGNLNTLAIKEKWLGINGKSNWRKNALQFTIFISLATGIFMFLGVQYTHSLENFRWYFLPIVLVISLTNSLSEEIIYRFAINGNLTTELPKTTVLILSGILFGLPHYFGFPSGIIGVMMSGVLGYILSKATYETQGIGIAWGIHFIQDVIIFTAIFMMNVKG
jgi:uncharacterized protein